MKVVWACSTRDLSKAICRGAFCRNLGKGRSARDKDVRGANNCKISVTHIEHSNTVVVLSVIDNLVKGASGQAIQCMNLLSALTKLGD